MRQCSGHWSAQCSGVAAALHPARHPPPGGAGGGAPGGGGGSGGGGVSDWGGQLGGTGKAGRQRRKLQTGRQQLITSHNKTHRNPTSTAVWSPPPPACCLVKPSTLTALISVSAVERRICWLDSTLPQTNSRRTTVLKVGWPSTQ